MKLLVLLGLFSAVVFTRADDYLPIQVAGCRCVYYLEEANTPDEGNYIGFQDILEFDCSRSQECSKYCEMLVGQQTNGGDLETWDEGKQMQIGSIVCDSMVNRRPVHRKYVVVYGTGCGYDLIKTGLRSKQPVCCNGSYDWHCPQPIQYY